MEPLFTLKELKQLMYTAFASTDLKIIHAEEVGEDKVFTINFRAKMAPLNTDQIESMLRTIYKTDYVIVEQFSAIDNGINYYKAYITY